MAAAAHGSAMVTEDVDVCIRFDLETLTRILAALRDSHPRHRMRPDRPIVSESPESLVGWRNLYLATDAGQLDLVSDVTGVGSYEAVAAHAEELDLGTFRCKVMGVDDLIRAKRTLGRPKDIRVALELEAIRRRG
jgi:hypothetical protein